MIPLPTDPDWTVDNGASRPQNEAFELSTRQASDPLFKQQAESYHFSLSIRMGTYRQGCSRAPVGLLLAPRSGQRGLNIEVAWNIAQGVHSTRVRPFWSSICRREPIGVAFPDTGPETLPGAILNTPTQIGTSHKLMTGPRWGAELLNLGKACAGVSSPELGQVGARSRPGQYRPATGSLTCRAPILSQ
jgi:hypothetical protein